MAVYTTENFSRLVVELSTCADMTVAVAGTVRDRELIRSRVLIAPDKRQKPSEKDPEIGIN